MQHKSFGNMQCPIARSLERVGEWWSILILRDAFLGLTRFDQFQKSLDIAPNILARRLNALVDAGLLERHSYSARPPRDEYVTDRARPRLSAGALVHSSAWGNKHFAPEGPRVVLVDSKTGEHAEPVLIDRAAAGCSSNPRSVQRPARLPTSARCDGMRLPPRITGACHERAGDRSSRAVHRAARHRGSSAGA